MNEFGEVLSNPNLTIAEIEREVAPLRAAMQDEIVRREQPQKVEKKTIEGRKYPGLPGLYWEVEDLLAV